MLFSKRSVILPLFLAICVLSFFSYIQIMSNVSSAWKEEANAALLVNKEAPSASSFTGGKLRPAVAEVLVPSEEKVVKKSSSSSSSFSATIVTSYFCVPSKRSKTAYLDYMKVMLSLQDPMVIFTAAEMRSTIESMRSHAMDRTHIVIVELQDLPVAKKYDSLDAGYWKHQLEIDEEKRIHRSFELFWIWLSKSHFVNEAIKLNPFSTDVFVWTDIGCFRSKEYTSKTLVMHPEEVPASKMLVMTSRDDRAEAGVKNQEWVEKRLKDHVMFVAGAQIAGRVETWKTFHIAFERVVQGYYDKGLFIGEDQNLIQSTCLQNLELCEFVSPKQTKGNRWFGLQYVLFHKRRDGVVVPPPVYVEETAEKEAPQKEAAKKSPISEVLETEMDPLRGHCLNSDFVPKNKVSVWTMLNDNPKYIEGGLKLGRSILQHTVEDKIEVDIIVMELAAKPLAEEVWVGLREIGYLRCTVDRIPPPNFEKTLPRFREKFAILHVWTMTMYDTVLFLDADTFITGPIKNLLSMDMKGAPIGVSRDIRGGKWVETFNSGVFLIHPSIAEYSRLMELRADETLVFEDIMADQGFLNKVYENVWHEIGFGFNANMAVRSKQQNYWKEHEDEVRIIHYTMQKPWDCNKPIYDDICVLWRSAP